MKERTKQILRYVACGLGGLALGIGLLGGLSMCATSGNKQTEDVNTILTKRNAKGTTEQGGYDKYTFDVPSFYSSESENWVCAKLYDVDASTYTLHWASTERTTIENGFYYIWEYIEGRLEAYTPTTNTYQFLLVEGHSAVGISNITNWVYFSFLCSDNWTNDSMNFVLTNVNIFRTCGLKDSVNLTARTINDPIVLNYETSNYFCLFDSAETHSNVGSYSFQDVKSYYKELGYQAGHTAGYGEGYDDAYAEKDSGIAFTSCGVYPNAHVNLATDETIGNFNYMYLCHYITKPGYDEHTIYIMWTTNAQTGQYLGEVIDRNDTDSYDPAVTLGSFTQQATSSVTITATEDMEFGLWVGYITTFHNRGEITNSILWFQGGTSESDLQIYQNGYDEGYQNGNQAGQETGYEQGYERGQEVGDAEGYSRGYTEGFNQTNTKNVFSLFTSAFDSVASFFDLKIFGFLPLYWFFLAPLFIALISLLMRMVKH